MVEERIIAVVNVTFYLFSYNINIAFHSLYSHICMCVCVCLNNPLKHNICIFRSEKDIYLTETVLLIRIINKLTI